MVQLHKEEVRKRKEVELSVDDWQKGMKMKSDEGHDENYLKVS